MIRFIRFFRTLFLLTAAVLALAACGSAANPTATTMGALTISNAWVRAAEAASSSGMNTGASYMTISSSGGADRLLSMRTDVAETVELHSSMNNGGVMSMNPVEDGIAIPVGGSIEMKPGGFHVMLIGLKKDLRVGDTVDLQLTFEQAGEVAVKASVRER